MTPIKKTEEKKEDAEAVKTIEAGLKPLAEKPTKFDRSGRAIGEPNAPVLVEVDNHIAQEPK